MSHLGTVRGLLKTPEPGGFTWNSTYTSRGALRLLIYQVGILGSQPRMLHPHMSLLSARKKRKERKVGHEEKKRNDALLCA